MRMAALIVLGLIAGIPALLVMAELFWFSGRCTRGGPHEWTSHPSTHLSAAWVICSKCGGEDF